MGEYVVAVAAGTLRSTVDASATFPHRWTSEGVSVECAFTGGHLLNLAVAGCVLNDVFREASALGVPVDGVRVTAEGGFDPVTWISTGITYSVTVDSTATEHVIGELLVRVDDVSEIPRAVRAGARVSRVGHA